MWLHDNLTSKVLTINISTKPMKQTHNQVSFPISRLSQYAGEVFSSLLKGKLLNIKHVWFAAALLFGLNLAVVFSPTFAPSAETHSGPIMGPACAELFSVMEQMGLSPSATGNITKDDFSVPGTLVAMAGDNIQIFEYPSALAAARESEVFIKESAAVASTMRSWERQASIYNKGSLVVYYLGANQEIMKALVATMGPPIVGEGASAFETEDGQ
jgi:hypothetical protein